MTQPAPTDIPEPTEADLRVDLSYWYHFVEANDELASYRATLDLLGINKRCAHAERKVAELTAERDKLQAFKDWVHSYLDSHGVPHHPPGTHGAEGCRIGDRMDWLMAKLETAERENSRLHQIVHDTLDGLGAPPLKDDPHRLFSRLMWLTSEMDRLRAALADALEGMQDMAPHVSEYIAEKWDHKGYIERAKKALEFGRVSEGTGE